MMKPGGTGSPKLVISARLAPLPPSRSFRSLLPSAKSYTYFSVTVPAFHHNLDVGSVRKGMSSRWNAVRECPRVADVLFQLSLWERSHLHKHAMGLDNY